MAQNEKKRNIAAKGITFIVQLCALVVFMCFFSYLALSQVASVRHVETQIAAVEEEIMLAQAEQDVLLREADYIGSDAFFEKMAREWLGMVRRDEIVYIISR